MTENAKDPTMDTDFRTLASMYVGLVVGCACLLLLGNVLGLTAIELNRSLAVSFVGVTTALYLGMFVTYKIVNPHTP